MTDLNRRLRQALVGCVEPGGEELCRVVEEMLLDRAVADNTSVDVALERLKPTVFRLRIGTGAGLSFVLKRQNPWLARRNEVVVRRCLPALGMSGRSPRLLATAADRRGDSVWHVYEDLGSGALDRVSWNREVMAAVVDVIAELHTRAAGHPLLPLCRHYCGDLGAPIFTANVRDAIAVLEDLVPGRVELTSGQEALRNRLLFRLYGLRNELPWRVQLLQALGGPETLLHGNLRIGKTFVAATSDGVAVHFIDWDHAAVGPASYDLSTFVGRFPLLERPWILEVYGKAIGRAGWRLPPERELNTLFETAEYARCTNHLIWPASALLEDGAEWGWQMLAEVERWFVAMTPALAV